MEDSWEIVNVWTTPALNGQLNDEFVTSSNIPSQLRNYFSII